MSPAVDHNVINDWNLLTTICETAFTLSKKSTLHINIIQHIFEIAYNINITHWLTHAYRTDEYIEQQLHFQANQDFLDYVPCAEFQDIINYASSMECDAKNGNLISAMYIFNFNHLRQTRLRKYSIFKFSPQKPRVSYTDWNLQNIICELMFQSTRYCSLNLYHINLICAFAFDIDLPTWKVYAAKYDQFVMDHHMRHPMSLQDHIEEQLSYTHDIFKEFTNQIIEQVYYTQFNEWHTTIINKPWDHCWITETYLPNSLTTHYNTYFY